MSKIISKEIHLLSRPNGEPKSENFKLVENEINPIQQNQVLVKNLWMSVDPYMRGRMIDRKSYIPPFEVGKTLEGGAIGVVIESNSPDFKKGDYVNSNYGWREYFSSNVSSLSKINPDIGPLQAYLGTLGMPGMTAYVGLLRIGELKEGENVLVSAAAGAVGTVACQIAKAKGCKVYGTAGSEEKCHFLENELGID
ncbi:MAG: NADP-dependent oxidoreductase, partial [Rhodobiaceae bacterium]|nr:NADP-dependent oxidoreductase [Rhodobiaceae bacterium]